MSQTTLRTTIPRSAVPLRELWPHAGARVFVAYWGALAVAEEGDQEQPGLDCDGDRRDRVLVH